MGALQLMPPGGSKIWPTASICNSNPPGLTLSVGDNCGGRPPALRASNSRAFACVTSARRCSLPSKSVGPLLLSLHLCPDGKKSSETEKAGGLLLIFLSNYNNESSKNKQERQGESCLDVSANRTILTQLVLLGLHNDQVFLCGLNDFLCNRLQVVDLYRPLDSREQAMDQTKIAVSDMNDGSNRFLIGKVFCWHVNPKLTPALFEDIACLVLRQ
jgi:hypothetical protein